MGKLNQQADMLGKGSKEAENGLKGLNKAAKADAVGQMAEKMGNLGADLVQFGRGVASAGSTMVDSFVKDAATFEDAEASMRFAFGEEQWENMFEKVKSEATDLTFMFSETLDLAASMGRIDVNPFGTTGDDLAVFKSKTGDAISALSTLQDTADATSRNAGSVALAVKNALGGQFRMLKNAADVGPELFKTWQDDIKAASTQQEKYNVLIQKLATQFGGAGALRAKNFNKVMAQIPDLLEIMRAAIGKAGLRKITEAVQEFVDALTALSKNKEAMKGMSDAFSLVAGIIAGAVRMLTTFVGWYGKLIAKIPALPTLIVIFFAVAAAISVAIGVTLVFAAELLAVVAIVSILGIKVIALGIAMFPVFIAVGAVILIVVAAFGALVAVMFQMGSAAGGSMGLLERMRILFSALVEIVQTFNGTSARLGRDTADNLRSAGLMEFAQDFVGILKGLNAFWEGLKAGWDSLVKEAGPDVLKMMDAISTSIDAVMKAFGFEQAASSTEGWTSAAMRLVGAFTQLVVWLAQIVTWVAEVVTVMAEWGILEGLVYTLIAVFVALGAIIVVIGVAALISFLPIIAVLVGIGLAVYVVVQAFMALYDAIVFVGEALGIIDKGSSKAVESTSKLTDELKNMANQKIPGIAQSLEQPAGRLSAVAPGRPGAPSPIAGVAGPNLPSGVAPGSRGLLKPGMGLVQPSHVLPPTVQGGTPGQGQDMGKVVSAVDGIKAAVTSLGQSIKGQKNITNVNLDGQRIAEHIKSYDDGATGENG